MKCVYLPLVLSFLSPLLVLSESPCEGVPNVSSCATSLFHKALSAAAGVYLNLSASAPSSLHPILAKSVVITVSNFGFLNLLHNLMCHTDRFGYKVLLIALDEELERVLPTMKSYGKTLFSYLWNGGKAYTKGL